jgi:oligopeptide transport system ATP-binding protein
MNNTRDILFLHNISVKSSRSGAKREFAVDEVSLSIRENEIFSIVGESDSGKTTLAHAIGGLEKLDRGIVYHDKKIVTGKVFKLYKMNKEIRSDLATINIALLELKKILEDFLSQTKVLYFKYISNLKYNPATEKVQKFSSKKNHTVETLEDATKLNYVLNVNEWRYINFSKEKQILIIDLLKDVAKNLMSQNRFPERIDLSSPMFSSTWWSIYSAKLVKEQDVTIKAKQCMVRLFHLTEELEKNRYSMTNVFKDFKCFYKSVFEIYENMVKEHALFDDLMVEIKDYQKQIDGLSLPLKKRKKYFDYYNKKVNLPRKNLRSDIVKFKNELITWKIENDARFNQSDLDYVNYQITDLWHEKSINFKSAKKYLEYLIFCIEEGIDVDKDKINKWVSTFYDSHAEKTLIEFHQEQILKRIYDVEKITAFLEQFKYIEKVVKKNVVTDRQLIDFWYKYKGLSIGLSAEKIDEYVDELVALELPSINDVASKSVTYRDPSKKVYKQNRREIQMIFKNPISSFDPKITIEQIIGEGLNVFPELYKNDDVRREYVEWVNSIDSISSFERITYEKVRDSDVKRYLIIKALADIGMSHHVLRRYPQEFTVSEIQKIAFARALVLQPRVIIADEPVSILDTSSRLEIIELMNELRSKYGISFLIIDRDISSAIQYSDRVAIMQNGYIIEYGEPNMMLNHPVLKYTKKIIESLPILKIGYDRKDISESQKQSALDFILDAQIYFEVRPGYFVYANDTQIKFFEEEVKIQNEKNN